MNIGKSIIEGALSGIGFALGTMVLGAVFAVFVFLFHNLIGVLLAPVLALVIIHGVKKHRDFRAGLKAIKTIKNAN